MKRAGTGAKAARKKAPAKRLKPAPRPAKGKAARPAVRPAKRQEESKQAAAKRPALKPAAAKQPAVKPTAAKQPALKPAAAKRPAVKLVPAVGRKPAKPAPEVKPIGMLPPEAMARATHRGPARPAQPAARARVEPTRPVRPPAPSEGVQRVTEKDLKEFEGLLLEERRKILKEMGHLETTVLKVNQRDSSGDLSGYSFHMADAGTDAMEREKAFQFASVEGRLLMEIDAALQRLYRGEYGVCETCGQPIGRARLMVMPYASLCVACKEKEERSRRGEA